MSIVSRTAMSCAAIGGIIGAFYFPVWADVVEQAQLISGVVRYSDKTPYYYFTTQTWWILPQICAVFLKLGLPEWFLCRIVSGILGAISFTAVGMATLAFSREILVAVAAPIIVFATGAYDYGATYNVYMAGVGSTSGILADSTLLLAPSLFALGANRAGAFILGLAPCIHPVMGAFLWLFSGMAMLWEQEKIRERFCAQSGWFLFGGVIAAASLLFQVFFVRDSPSPADPALIDQLYRNFIQYWDYHRSPFPVASSAVIIGINSIVVHAVILAFSRTKFPVNSLFLSRYIIIAASISLAFVFLSHMSVERMPRLILLLMPQRFLNICILGFAPIVMGIASWSRHSIPGQVLFLLLFATGFGLRLAGRLDDSLFLFLMMAFAVAFVGLPGRTFFSCDRRILRALSALRPIVLLVLIALIFFRLDLRSLDKHEMANGGFFEIVSEQEGILATAPGVSFVPLRTRRQLLVDVAGLDHLPYAGSTGPFLNDILRDFYGIDILNPPENLQPSGQVPIEPTKSLWERRTSGEWLEAAMRSGVREIVAPANWDLNLPVVTENEQLALFRLGTLTESAAMRSTQLVMTAVMSGKAGDSLAAVRTLEKLIRDNPEHGPALFNLAVFRAAQGEILEAITLYGIVVDVWSDWPSAASRAANNLAWIFATESRADLRDGATAVRLARRANDDAGYADPFLLDTLAAAYAEAGDFDKAVSTALRAVRLARVMGKIQLADAIEFRCEEYQAGRPHRERL